MLWLLQHRILKVATDRTVEFQGIFVCLEKDDSR